MELDSQNAWGRHSENKNTKSFRSVCVHVCPDMMFRATISEKKENQQGKLNSALKWPIHQCAQIQNQQRPSQTILIHTFLSWFGNIQRTKFGLVLFSVCISLTSCSLYVWATVRNIPLRVRTPTNTEDSLVTVALMPTISATFTHMHKQLTAVIQ